MGSWIAGAAVAGNLFTLYPGFIDPDYPLQAVTDKGTILEIVVACKPGEGIMSYSKPERLFCLPDASCHRSMQKAVRRLCTGS